MNVLSDGVPALMGQILLDLEFIDERLKRRCTGSLLRMDLR
jgi:hypothetical protein